MHTSHTLHISVACCALRLAHLHRGVDREQDGDEEAPETEVYESEFFGFVITYDANLQAYRTDTIANVTPACPADDTGDIIEVTMSGSTWRYAVTDMHITTPDAWAAARGSCWTLLARCLRSSRLRRLTTEA